MRHIRNLLFFFVGLTLGSWAVWANAGYALATPPAGFTPTQSGLMYRAPADMPAPANGNYTGNAHVRSAGRNITVPAAWRFAANAPSFAANAVRLNPAVFVGTTVATWLATEYLLEWVESQWQVLDSSFDSEFPNSSGSWTSATIQGYQSVCNPIPCSLAEALEDTWGAIQSLYPNAVLDEVRQYSETSWGIRYTRNPESSSIYVGFATRTSESCPSGYTQQSGMCVPGTQTYRPATQDDWAQLNTANWPDTSLHSVAKREALPIEQPELEPVTVPLGDPYTDPATGQQWQDKVRIQPQPTPDSPFRVRMDEYRDPLTTPEPTPENPNPEPEPDPTRQPESIADEWPLFCDWAQPVCDVIDWFKQEAEPVEDPEMPWIEDEEIPSSPVSLPTGAGCPAPRQLPLAFGTVALEYDPFCQFADTIRPIVLAAAFLFAAFIVAGVRK